MKPASSLAVIKVGGSLFDWPLLPGRLIAFSRRFKMAAWPIAPCIAGGGAAVDVIRTLDRLHRLGDETAHQLALHALDLTAVVLAAIVPGSVMIDEIEALAAAWERRLIPIMAPRRVLEAIGGLPQRRSARELGGDIRHDCRTNRRASRSRSAHLAQEPRCPSQRRSKMPHGSA